MTHIDVLKSFYRERQLHRGSKKDHLYRSCLKMIERGFWTAGDRLPTDLQLAADLPISLGSV